MCLFPQTGNFSVTGGTRDQHSRDSITVAPLQKFHGQ